MTFLMLTAVPCSCCLTAVQPRLRQLTTASPNEDLPPFQLLAVCGFWVLLLLSSGYAFDFDFAIAFI